MKHKRKRLARFGFKDFTKWYFDNKNHIFIKPFQHVHCIDKTLSELKEYFSGKKSMCDKRPFTDALFPVLDEMKYDHLKTIGSDITFSPITDECYDGKNTLSSFDDEFGMQVGWNPKTKKCYNDKGVQIHDDEAGNTSGMTTYDRYKYGTKHAKSRTDNKG